MGSSSKATEMRRKRKLQKIYSQQELKSYSGSDSELSGATLSTDEECSAQIQKLQGEFTSR